MGPQVWAANHRTRSAARTSPLVEAAQLARPCRVTQLAERLCFDLPDTLPGDGEARADFLERHVGTLPDAEAQAKHLLFPGGERAENLAGLAAQVGGDHGIGGGHRPLVLEEVAEMAVLLLPDRRLERDRLARDAQDATDLLGRQLHLAADLLRGRLAPELLHQ